jgi:hypothetical protein
MGKPKLHGFRNQDLIQRRFLTLHTTHTTTEEISLILKGNIKYLRKSGTISTVILVCV